VLNNFTAASYETSVRATAVGMELSIARIGAILGPVVAGTLHQIYQSPTPMFLSIGVAAIGAGAVILFAKAPPVETPDAAASRTVLRNVGATAGAIVVAVVAMWSTQGFAA